MGRINGFHDYLLDKELIDKQAMDQVLAEQRQALPNIIEVLQQKKNGGPSPVIHSAI